MSNLFRRDRRALLQNLGMGAAAAALSSFATVSAAAAPSTQPTRRRSLRLAHLTDVHVQPELAAGKGLAQCLQHVQSESDKPELILFGGDCVYETMHHDADRTKLQWDLWQSVLKQENSLPLRPILGNHDVWGWNKKKSKSNGAEPLWGKKYALNRLSLAQSYYSFDQAGWHFVMLDSIFPNGDSYMGKLDEAQFAWLGADLAQVAPTTPVLVLSHIPILTITGYIPQDNDTADGIKMDVAAVHMDFGRIRDLFRKHPNVKLCISGHTHLIDDVTYLGVRYCCNGAVCGNWWKGNHLDQCAEGYTLIDLYDDGTAELNYRGYGWVAQTPTTQPKSDASILLPRMSNLRSRVIAS